MALRHGPDGRAYQNRITFEEVVNPSAWSTGTTAAATFPSAEARERVIKDYGAAEGMVQTLARLEAHLQAQRPGAEPSRAKG